MDLMRVVIGLGPIQSSGAIILREAGAESDAFTQGNVLAKPVGTARPAAGQAVSRRGQGRALKIILAVPVAQPTAVEHEEYGLRISRHQVRGQRFIVGALVAQAINSIVI